MLGIGKWYLTVRTLPVGRFGAVGHRPCSRRGEFLSDRAGSPIQCWPRKAAISMINVFDFVRLAAINELVFKAIFAIHQNIH